MVEGKGDTDNSSFTIDDNQLKAAESFDYETKDEYSIRVKGTNAGGLSIEKVFTINVSDANDAPIGITLSEDSVPENQQKKGFTVGTLAGIDPDAGDKLTFTLVDGAADNAQFTLSGTSICTAGPFDAETTPALTLRVRATDKAGATFEQDIPLTVENVNEAPTDISLDPNTVAENSPKGTEVGIPTTTDPDDLKFDFNDGLVAYYPST